LKYYHFADLLVDKNFQLTVQEMRHEIVGQETLLVFLDLTLKVIRCFFLIKKKYLITLHISSKLAKN
jgi:hypothetical protein